MIGIDTLSWSKLIKLLQTTWQDITSKIIEQTDIFITQSVKKELVYRYPDHTWITENVIIFPDITEESEVFRKQGFDEVDISLLLYALHYDYYIITEDYQMLTSGMINSLNVMMLVDFFHQLYHKDFFQQEELDKLIELFRKWRNITKRKAKVIRDHHDTVSW